VIVPSFTYRVDAFGGVQGHDQDGKPTRSAHVFVDGVQRPQAWLGHFALPERDLLRVAAAVLDLDRLSLRRPLNTKGPKRELLWRRAIDAVIAVEDPSRWSAVSDDLHALLALLADDVWTLTFEQAEPFREQRLLFAPELDGSAEIALFSGGLDSSVGLRARHLKSGCSFVAVSAVGNEVRRRAQDAALQTLRGLGVGVSAISIEHQLRSEVKLSRRALETTQRTRGLFFLSIGAAVASRLGSPKFHVYETGIGCLNVPTSPAQIASQGTRAMHPLTLVRFNSLMARVLDHPTQVLVPFFFMTKGELCALVRDDLRALAQKCSSCDEGDGHKPDPMEHCGLCTSCMFRRIAIVSAGVPDPTRYRDTPSRRHNSYEVAAFEYHATDLSRIATLEDLTDLDPNVRFAFNAPTGVEISLDVARSRTVEMYRRYAEEIQRFLSAARPKLQPRAARPAKEVDRDLFAAAR
jgi:7-cyano-7-deazaguanine synthase in queuosine biosynthesis